MVLVRLIRRRRRCCWRHHPGVVHSGAEVNAAQGSCLGVARSALAISFVAYRVLKECKMQGSLLTFF